MESATGELWHVGFSLGTPISRRLTPLSLWKNADSLVTHWACAPSVTEKYIIGWMKGKLFARPTRLS